MGPRARYVGTPANTQVVPTPTPTPTPLPTFTDFYRNTTEGFFLSLPAGWVAQETGGRTPALTVETPPGANFLLAEVYVFRLPDPQPAQEWLTDQVASYGDIQIVVESPVQLGPDTAGYQALLTWRTSRGVEVREQWTGVVRGTQGFLVRVMTMGSGYDSLLVAINAFSSSFTLEVPAPFGASRNDSLFRWGGQILTLDPALFRGSPAGIPGAIFSGLSDETSFRAAERGRIWGRASDLCSDGPASQVVRRVYPERSRRAQNDISQIYVNFQ